MTNILATSVVRGSQQGDSHGGAFLIDFARGVARQTLDWNAQDIDWSGRGWDRGLRGIAFDKEKIYLAASDELFIYDQDFNRLHSHRNQYLKHCHVIAQREGMIFLTSTGYDAILGFDLMAHAFRWGLALTTDGETLRARPFDPLSAEGPAPSNRFHLNSIYADHRGLFFSGLRTAGLLRFAAGKLSLIASLPEGSHDAQPYRDGILFNDTRADVVRFVAPNRQRTFDVPRYPDTALTHQDLDDSRIARQAFGRGLCVAGEGLIAAGSSPATVALHHLDDNRTLSAVTLSMDVRTAIHGLAVWPFV